MNQTWKIVVAVIITAIIVGGGVYLWQQQKVIETSQVTPKVQVPISEVPEVKPPAPVTSTKVTYKNDKYGFSIGFPDTWKDYTVTERKGSENYLGIFDFELSNESLFAVAVYTKAEFAKINPDEDPIIYNTKIAENASFVFSAVGSQDNSTALYPRRQEVEDILKTFKAY